MVVSVLAIKLIEYDSTELPSELLMISKPIFAMAAIVYPMMDTFRIFMIRAFSGRSPFSADRNHIHHKLIDWGLSHRASVMIIYTFTILTVTQASLIVMEANRKLALILFFVLIMAWLPPFLANRKLKMDKNVASK